ncbi:hypothetical protein C2845_PM11G11560 [Panicum miliaceum]|uniref:Uncharacterized protein n=1 Tax=Panicum miliaceum TaxID=4540 RepID=A0A3L6RR56_PANMI|nr:hypothetical protein C2845_PM11G11560 [Panicum miliaceum]
MGTWRTTQFNRATTKSHGSDLSQLVRYVVSWWPYRKGKEGVRDRDHNPVLLG